MSDEDFEKINKKIDKIEQNFLLVCEERDKWKRMYYEMKGLCEGLMSDTHKFIQEYEKLE